MIIGRLKQKIIHLFYRPLGIPFSNDNLQFEKLFYDLNKSLFEESPFINKVMSDITDNEVIYQKGEGAELILNIDGKVIPRKGAILMSKYFIAKRVDLILQATKELKHKNLIDVGATSDVIFRYLNKNALGLNISEKAVNYMKSQGIEAVLGNAEDLKFEDKRFDYLLCFETIEHLENPIKSLKEFRRVTKEKIFITIPNIKETRVCPFEPKDRGRHRWHFIEFGRSDFRHILRRTGLDIVNEIIIHPYGKAKSVQQRLFKQKWKNHPWFEGFVFYELVPFYILIFISISLRL